jgi:hypothetical protein
MNDLDSFASSPSDPSSRNLPTLREFSRRFKRKYGRTMTQEERRFFHLMADLVDNPPLGAAKGGSKISPDGG